MLEGVDRAAVSAYASRHTTAATEAVLAHAGCVGIDTVHDRLVRAGERTDRRLASYLTGGAFVVALGGFSVARPGNDYAIQGYLAGVAGLLGAAAFLFALRGTTRVGATLLTHEADAQDLTNSLAALRVKEAWGWLASRLLFTAVVLQPCAHVFGPLTDARSPKSPETLGRAARNHARVPANCGTPARDPPCGIRREPVVALISAPPVAV